MASTSIVCHRERGTGERVWPHHNRDTVHAHTRHVSQRSARAALTAGSGPFDEISAAVAGIRSTFMGLPQRPLRASCRFSWNSRTSRCGNKIHLMGPLRGAQLRAPEIAPERIQSVRLPRSRRCNKRGSAARPMAATRAVQVGALLASATASPVWPGPRRQGKVDDFSYTSPFVPRPVTWKRSHYGDEQLRNASVSGPAREGVMGGRASASTSASGANARSAGGRAYARTSAGGANARSAGGRAYASTSAKGANARSAGGRASASTSASGANARSAGGRAYARTSAGGANARSAGGRASARTSAGGANARSAARRPTSRYPPAWRSSEKMLMALVEMDTTYYRCTHIS
jgi:hypothetical protein